MTDQLNGRASEVLQFLENPVLLASLSSWFFAQFLKAMIVLIRSPSRSVKEILMTFFWRTGGMPSSHSALVTSLACTVAFQEGFGSNLFIVTLCLALIVIRDSLGVRRSSGLQARLLNTLTKEMNTRFKLENSPVKEVQGHAPLEVLIGALVGVFIAIAFSFL